MNYNRGGGAGVAYVNVESKLTPLPAGHQRRIEILLSS